MSENLSFKEMAEFITAGLTTRKRNLHQYEPHDKQKIFHSSKKRGRLYAGGNRSGKTTGGIVEDLWWLTRTHPFIKTPEPPVIGRLCTVDFENGIEKIILPNLRQWCPPSYLVNGSWNDSWSYKKKKLTLANDSELEIMSYSQELDKFAGVPRHFIHCDEEPPKAIFEECRARLTDYGGSWWITMTPIDGITWTYDDIFEPGIKGDPLIDVIMVNIFDNPHLSPEEIEIYLAGFSDEDMKTIRSTGAYIPIGGLMLKFFNEELHVLNATDPGGVAFTIPPRNWVHWNSMDHGFANPTAWLWHAVDPKTGVIVTYDEHYKAEMTVKQHADFVKEKNDWYRRNHGITIHQMVGDPAIKQRQATSGISIQSEYAQEGIYIALGQTRSVEAGINKMNTYLQTNKWFISGKCINFIKEAKKYKRKPYQSIKIADRSNKNEAPQKKDDHACDSARYFFSFMPELQMDEIQKGPRMSKDEVAALMGAGTTYDPLIPYRMDNNLMSDISQQAFVADEYVGEY